jgi:hypothetical protein
MSLAAPVWRIVGSAGSWLIFAFSFTIFALGLVGVIAVGGTCADGGPFVIAVHCPENTDILTLGGVYGGLGGVFVALVVARGFGTRIILAWTILFLGIAIPFLLAGLPFVIGGVVIFLMAIAPLVIDWRAAGPQRTFLGITDAAGRRFREREGARESFLAPGAPNRDDAVAPTAGDWTLSLGLWIGSIALGVVLGILAFSIA